MAVAQPSTGLVPSTTTTTTRPRDLDQQRLIDAVRQEAGRLGSNQQYLLPPQMSEAEARRYLEAQQNQDYLYVLRNVVGVAEGQRPTDAQIREARALNRAAFEEVENIANKYERSDASLNSVARAVLSGDYSGLSGQDLLMAAGPPPGIRSGTWTREVLERELSRAESSLQAQPAGSFGPAGPSFAQQAVGSANLPLGAPLKIQDQWYQWNGSGWQPLPQAQADFLEQNGVAQSRLLADGAIVFVDAQGQALGGLDPQGNDLDAPAAQGLLGAQGVPGQTGAGAGVGTGQTATSGTGGGDQDLSDLLAQYFGGGGTGVLGQKPPWWDDNVFGAFERFTPSQVAQIYEQAQAGQWGPQAQQRVMQFGGQAAGTGQGETFQDPNTGRWFMRQPNGTIQPLDTGEGAGANVPSLEEQVSQAILERRFNDAVAIQDFVNRATPQQRMDAALAYARSPADFFTISNALAGTLNRPAGDGQVGRIGQPASFLQEAFGQFMGGPDFSQFQGPQAAQQAGQPGVFNPAPTGDPRIDERNRENADIQQGQLSSQIAQALQPFLTSIQQAAARGDPLSAATFQSYISQARLLEQHGAAPAGTADALQRRLTRDYPQLAGQVGSQIASTGSGQAFSQQLGATGANTGSFLQTAFGGGSIGPSGLLTTPRLENLIQGNVQGQPSPLFSQVGLRTPSAQALSRTSPSELEMFGEIGRLTGIPEAEFQRELLSAVPGGSTGGSFLNTSQRKRRVNYI